MCIVTFYIRGNNAHIVKVEQDARVSQRWFDSISSEIDERAEKRIDRRQSLDNQD